MIDHLVYTVRDMSMAEQAISGALGASFSPGGRHPNRGTVNRLLRIGPATYLELLAADPNNATFTGDRWMGVDLLPESINGRLTRWALSVPGRSDSPRGLRVGEWQAGSRELADGTTLRWELTDPGTDPPVDPSPFLINWFGRPSPAERLPEVSCRLTALHIAGPDVTGTLAVLGELPAVQLSALGPNRITARIEGPGGAIVL